MIICDQRIIVSLVDITLHYFHRAVSCIKYLLNYNFNFNFLSHTAIVFIFLLKDEEILPQKRLNDYNFGYSETRYSLCFDDLEFIEF